MSAESEGPYSLHECVGTVAPRGAWSGFVLTQDFSSWAELGRPFGAGSVFT